MSVWTVPLSPWWARERKAVAREKRRASHGPWLARNRATYSHWARGPEYAVALSVHPQRTGPARVTAPNPEGTVTA